MGQKLDSEKTGTKGERKRELSVTTELMIVQRKKILLINCLQAHYLIGLILCNKRVVREGKNLKVGGIGDLYRIIILSWIVSW